MAKSSVVKARMEPKLKEQGEAVLHALGLNTTTAITLFFTQLVQRRSFPLELKVPNAETVASFDEAKASDNATGYSSVSEALEAVLDSE